MKKKVIAVLTTLFIVLAVVAVVITENLQMTSVNSADVNDVLKTAEENIDSDLATVLREKNYSFPYCVTAKDGTVLFKSNDKSKINAYDAISVGGSVLSFNGGTLIISGDLKSNTAILKRNLLIILIGFLLLSFLICLFMFLYTDKRLLKPFSKMRKLAGNIAEGNFDVPLEMDKGNIFGAFTESFDLLRNELQRARENERAASESKKQLVASLSHDIKTPLASIKAIAELLSVQVKDEKQKEKLRTIDQKVGQIGLLTNNLFHATLEELHELKVAPTDEQSSILSEFLSSSDYLGKIKSVSLKEVLIRCDKLRTQQVFDNIIGNSYKYAGTPIKVTSKICDGFLVVSVIDSGGGVPESELSLITQKFYRGKNSEGKDGSGIGLYMCSYFMDKMGGHFEATNKDGGFAAVLYFKLS